MTKTDPIHAEFTALLLRSGLNVPLERQPILFRSYMEVRSWSEIIRSWEKAPTDEPANIYDMRTITRV